MESPQEKETRNPVLLARGERLKQVRGMLNMNTKEFAELCGAGVSTIGQWEQGRVTGLAEKSARQIVNALKNTAVQCNMKWLLDGTGEPPFFLMDKLDTYRSVLEIQEPGAVYMTIKMEVEMFRKSNPDHVVLQIQDQSMVPFFKPGDYVGGRRINEDEHASLMGTFCIAQTLDGQILLRRFHGRIPPTNKYRLTALNFEVHAGQNLLLDAELVSIANVTRFWRSML